VVRNIPEEKLRCIARRGHYEYYIGKKYLGKDQRPYAKQIAQKEYCRKLEKKVAEYETTLKKLQDLYENEELERIYRELHEARKQLVTPLAEPIEYQIAEFEKIPYEPKGFSEEDRKEYYTAKGERVRSKSEMIIANELFRYAVPYKYEYPLQLASWNKNIEIYPDFTVLNKRTGKQWIIEHLGMMDNAAYSENAMRKLELYEKNDILLGEKLIIFHETSSMPLNANIVRKYIEQYLC